MGRVFRNEFRLMLHDAGVLLFFVALPLLYPIVYTLIYNPEVLRKLPVAVVDEVTVMLGCINTARHSRASWCAAHRHRHRSRFMPTAPTCPRLRDLWPRRRCSA